MNKVDAEKIQQALHDVDICSDPSKSCSRCSMFVSGKGKVQTGCRRKLMQVLVDALNSYEEEIAYLEAENKVLRDCVDFQ